MKIIVASTSFPYFSVPNLSIAGKFVLEECIAYELAGATVEVVTPDIPNCPKEELFGKNIIVHRFRYFSPRRYQTIKREDGSAVYDNINYLFYFQLPFFIVSFAWSLFQLSRKNKKTDIIHCNWSITALCALPIKYLLKIPIVLTTRGSDLRLIPRWLNKFIFKHVDGIIDCFGPDYKKILNKLPGKFIELPVIVSEPELPIENHDSIYSSEEDSFTIVMLSRFDRTKQEKYGMAFFSLLDALAELTPKYNLNCIFVGDGELKTEIEQKALSLGLKTIVKFVGYQKNIFHFLNNADLVLGGVGLNAVSQEATLLGKVQLMPRIPFWYESVWFNKINVILYNPDDVSSVKEGVEFAIKNPEKMRTISKMVNKSGNKYIIARSKGGIRYMKEFAKIIDEYSN